MALAVLVVGIVVVGLLTSTALMLNNNNENRLLGLQVREAGAVLSATTASIGTTLAASVEIASATGGNPAKFKAYMSTHVGHGQPFVSASLWDMRFGVPVEVAVIGAAPELADNQTKAAAFLSRAVAVPQLSVTAFLGDDRRLGYGYGAADRSLGFVTYAETALPAHKVIRTPSSSAFSDLKFAIYLGRSVTPGSLLESTTAKTPITGRVASTVVPFGTSAITLVASPTGTLGGNLPRFLPLVIAVVGILLTAAAALTSQRLIRRRRVAEQLATEVSHLYGEQRGIAESLQRALLPATLPAIPGLASDARYLAGVETMDIGGDWYDLIACADGGFIFVIGDVSGRGLEAATIMASLHYAIRAYAAGGDPPSTILSKLSGLLDIDRDGHFATVLCGQVDGAHQQMTLASAGHFAPLIRSGEEAYFAPIETGPPVGIRRAPEYPSVTLPIPPAAVLVLFTDGLVERRDEPIDTSLERLRQSMLADRRPLDEVMTHLVDGLTARGAEDDTALLGLRWLG